MSRRSIVTAALLLLALPLLAADSGQEIRINTHTQGQQYFPAVAMDRHGNSVVVWQGDGPAGLGIYGRLFDRTGGPRGDQFLVAKATLPELLWGESVSLDEIGFVVAWAETSKDGQRRRLFARAMRLDGTPAARPVELGQAGYGDIVLAPDGRFLLVTYDADGMFAQLRERSGEPAGDRVLLANPGGLPVVARHGAAGYVVAWAVPNSRVQALFLDAAGHPSGEPILVADGQENIGGTALASAPDGRFVVSWLSYTLAGVFARPFGASGAPLTPVLKVGGEGTTGDGNTSVAMDAEGRFLVAWTQYEQLGALDDGNVHGRRYEASGTPSGGPFRVSVHLPGTQNFGSVAAGPSGDFLAAWVTGPGSFYADPQDGSGAGIFGRRLAWARPGADPCAFGPDGFACDTAHNGGKAELVIPLHPSQAYWGLLGDLNGDGRDDPCLFHDGIFLCDTAHDGDPTGPGDSPAIVFGGEEDVPLMADFDGEGRDDPCVRRGTWFLCDTAHDGGNSEMAAEMAINFGETGDEPLVGDVDGDGDDDPCVHSPREPVFLCDTVHDGQGAEVVISFGKPGDFALLGDLDGDGRDDPCVIRGDRLLCDTAHNGGKAELSLRFTLPGYPLLGNVDGL
ncbi:MAG TPA: hypothetical protein VH394_10305 [Thermoanaerobaculia bacterium]|jgi:hypothetical protein|nr:hypothetical protein [Thermoanaerobaculia bacterium]